MDSRSNILIWIILIIIIMAIGLTFYKVIIEQDFEILQHFPEITPEEIIIEN